MIRLEDNSHKQEIARSTILWCCLGIMHNYKPCRLWKFGEEKKEKKQAAKITVAGNLLLLLEECYSTSGRNGLKSGMSSEGQSLI